MDKFKKLIQANEGFTLVELLLAIAILGIFMTMIIPMIIEPFNIVVPSSQRMSAKQMAELNVTEISRYIRNANEEDIDTEENKIITDKVTVSYNDDDNTINIENGVTRSFNNITYFNINKDDDNYKITLEKKETGKVTTIINPRKNEGGNDNDDNDDNNGDDENNENGEPTIIKFVTVQDTISNGGTMIIEVKIEDNDNLGISGKVVDFEIDNNGIPARTSINLNIVNDTTNVFGIAKVELEVSAHKHDEGATFIIKASHDGLNTEHTITISK